MGVRGAGSRRPDELDMAPALTHASVKPAPPAGCRLAGSKPPAPSLDGHKEPPPADRLSILAIASELLKSSAPSAVPPAAHRPSLGVGGGSGDPGAAMSAEPDYAKDKGLCADMDQLWRGAGGAGDMGANVEELLQVIKSMESSRPDLSAEDMFPLTDASDALSSLFPDDDAGLMADQSRDMLARERVVESQKAQAELERRCARLARRLWKLQARAVGRHVGEELLGFLDATRRRATPPLSMSAMIQRLDCVAQRQAATRHGAAESALPVEVGAADDAARRRLRAAASQLRAQLSMVEAAADSDATASSSGGESCDEMQPFNNQHQQHLAISRRAAWRWARERAEIAGRWTWLQAQISDLEYRIRQHGEIHRQLRVSKGAVLLAPPAGAVNGLKGAEGGGGARVRPLDRAVFRKRKLLQGAGLHLASRKAARPATTRCRCVSRERAEAPCLVCTGRADPTAGLPLETMSPAERAAVLDPALHPVLSLPQEVRESARFAAEMRGPERQHKMLRASLKVLKAASVREETNAADAAAPGAIAAERRNFKLDQQKKYRARLKRSVHSRPLLSKMRVRSLKAGRKAKGSGDARSVHSGSLAEHRYSAERRPDDGNRLPSPEPAAVERHAKERRRREDSYDIDNIIIPRSYSSAARVEILAYKEIPTPKWRLVEGEADADAAAARESSARSPSTESDVEDCSDEAIALRHEKSLADEKRKFTLGLKMPPFMRGRAQRRTDSLAESSGANTPDPMSPAAPCAEGESRSGSPLASPPATPQPTDADAPLGLAARRRTFSQTRLPRDDSQQQPFDSTPDVFVAPFEKRRFPLADDVAALLGGCRLADEPSWPPSEPRPNEPRKAVALAATKPPADLVPPAVSAIAGAVAGRLSPCSESTDSGRDNDDPNDPEWTEKEDRDAERDKLKLTAKR